MSAYGNSSPQGLGAEPPNADHIGFDISSVDELSLGVCSIYEWDSASSGYDFVNSDFITFAECRDKLATSSYGADSVAYFEFPEYLHQYADDALHDADCDTCRRKYMDSGPNAIEGQTDSMYPENIMRQQKYYTRLPTGGSISATFREPFANDYSLENGSLCVRIGEHGWPGPPQIGLPETFINPSSFLDVFDNRPSNPVNLLREFSSEFDYTKHNLPYYGYPQNASLGIGLGLHAGYKGEKILENTNDPVFSANGSKKIASFPAWIRPVTVTAITAAKAGTYLPEMYNDGNVTTEDILNGNQRAGRNEWFGSWIMPETYPSNELYATSTNGDPAIDPQYNVTANKVGDPVPLGPQLVGWLCGFSSPAYKVSKDHYDAENQVWLDTYHYCLDKFTCPELFKESIMDRNGNRLASSVDFDRGTASDPCVEPLIPINVNTNYGQNNTGPATQMELITSQGSVQTFKTYAESDGNNKTFLGMCDGGMIEFHKMISATTSNFIPADEGNPIQFLSNNLDLNITSSGSSWNGNMRSVYPLMMQGTPFFGIQRPITASQGQLGSWNSSHTYPTLRTNDSVFEVGDYLHGLYSPGNIGLGGEYLHGARDGVLLYSMYDSPINIGSNTGRNLRGIPKTGNHIPGTQFNGGTDINTGACSTPEYSVTPRVGSTTSDVTKMYYPCLCDVTHLDPDNSSYNVQNALTNFSSVSMKTLPASSAGDPGYLKSQIRVSDPVAPGVCALKHGDVPRMIVKMYKGESDTGDSYNTLEGVAGLQPSSGGSTPDHYLTPQNAYTYTVRNNMFLDNKFHLIDLLNLGANQFGPAGKWSSIVTAAIANTLVAESTLPEFESCCLPDGTCTNELEYARCIDQGGTPRNVSCDVPCEGGEMNTIGSCCYVDPDTGRPTSSDGITKQTCKRLKGSFSDTKTAHSRVNNKEAGCCETCGGSFRNTDINLTGGRFRSRASSSETDIRTTDITSFDKALNEELKTELQNSYKNCNLPDAYRLSAERYESLIMNYEYEKDLACTNARVKGMDLNLVSYFNCKCTLLDEFVTNMKNTYKENVCQILENQTDPMKTILAVKMEELIEVNRRFENNCLAIIESDTGAVSTFEKAKGCCCRYAKDGYQLGNSRYNENDLVGCSHISKFECDKFVNFNTKWTRCLSECRDGCSTPDNPANCTRCSDRFDGTSRVTPTSRSSSLPSSSTSSTTTTRTSQSSSSPPQSGSGY